MLMLGNLIYAKTYKVDCTKSECTGTMFSNFSKSNKCRKPDYIGMSNLKYSWNSKEKKCYGTRVYSKKEKKRMRKEKELKRKRALLQQKKNEALEKKRKERKLKLKSFDVYAGIKMYSYVKENKKLNYYSEFELFGLKGKVNTNNHNEIIGIELNGKASNDKAEKIKKSLLKKYKKISEKKYTISQSYDELNDKAYKLYQLGIVTGQFYKMFTNGLTDKSSKIDEIILTDNKTQIVFKKTIVDFKHKVETVVKIEYLSEKLLNANKKKKRMKEKQEKKTDTEINEL
jgi:hypothetical protein